MPYNRRYKKKRKRHSAYGILAKSAGYAYPIAKKALFIAAKAKALLNVEFKCIDSVFSNQQIDSATPTISLITNVAQGDTATTRDGNQIKLTQVVINMLFTVVGTNTGMRYLLVHDKQTNGAAFVIGDLLASNGTQQSLVSGLNIDNKYRFRILADKKFTLTNSGSNRKVTKKIFIPNLNIRMRFDGGSNSITDVTSSSLALVVLSEDTGASAPLMSAFIRVRFVDN